MSLVSRRRLRTWIANPWGEPRLLAAFTWAFMAWLIVPLVIAVLISFNADRSVTFISGPSLAWWIGGELDTGETVFTTTYADHQRAIEQWQAWCRDNPDSGC